MTLSSKRNAFSSHGISLHCSFEYDLLILTVFRKESITPPVNFTAYKSWLASPSTAQGEASGSNPPVGDSATSSEPAYPSSFAHIVELITTGQPIPGIQEIPDTVLEGHDLASEKPRRRKPWEKDDAPPNADDTPASAV